MSFHSLRRSNVFTRTLLAAAVAGLCGTAVARAEELPLTSLDLKLLVQDYGTPEIDLSVEKNPLSIGGHKYEHGLGSHASSRMFVDVNGATRFTATVGIDDDVGKRGAVRFQILTDKQVLFDSGLLKGGEAGKAVDIPLAGFKQILLLTLTGPAGDEYCHADWADAKFEFTGVAPRAVGAPKETAEILTPPAPHTPRINGAAVFGVRPGHPILFTVPATGDRPITFKASGLPDGATFDSATGRLGGAVATAGTYPIHLTATNSLGTAERDFKLVVGDKLALTPLMGWNSWYGFANRVSDAKMRQAADMLVSTGLTDHGYAYVCIDDFWQQTPHQMQKDPTLGGPGRDAAGNLVPNPRFPDMKALADYIHSKGLKAGLYTSPGPLTCGGALGCFDHEAADATAYATWGFDLLKFDWCSYRPALEAKRTTPLDPKSLAALNLPTAKSHEQYVLPYALMGEQLKKQNRDIFYLMCQYGMGDSWNWGDTVGGQSARTTGDITDSWGSMSGIGFGQATKRGVSGPGFWGDPDMLMVGVIGLDNPHPSHLTPNEQYTQVTLWSILPAPLLFGAHLDKLDAFTLNLLTNDEVIAVDQDPLGKSATRVATIGQTEVWSRELEDGSRAVALFNRSEFEQPITAKWADVGVTGKYTIRDLWRQKDVGASDAEYSATVPRHGVMFVKLVKQ